MLVEGRHCRRTPWNNLDIRCPILSEWPAESKLLHPQIHSGPSIIKATNNASIKATTANPKAIWPNSGFRVTQKTRLTRMAAERSANGEISRRIRSRDFQGDISDYLIPVAPRIPAPGALQTRRGLAPGTALTPQGRMGPVDRHPLAGSIHKLLEPFHRWLTRHPQSAPAYRAPGRLDEFL